MTAEAGQMSTKIPIVINKLNHDNSKQADSPFDSIQALVSPLVASEQNQYGGATICQASLPSSERSAVQSSSNSSRSSIMTSIVLIRESSKDLYRPIPLNVLRVH